MAGVTRQHTGELLLKPFEILVENPHGLQARDAISAVEKAIPLTEYELGCEVAEH